MTQKRKVQEIKINEEAIFNALSDDVENTYQELLCVLKQKTYYKNLKKYGEGQYLNPVTDCDQLSSVIKARNCLNIINLHAVQVYDLIDEIVSKKFNDKNFHNKLKQKILKIILKTHYKDDSSEVEKKLLQDNFEDRSRNDEMAVLETLKDISDYCAESLNDIRIQVNEMPIEEAKPTSFQNVNEKLPCRKKEEPMCSNKSTFNEDDLSFESLSSVHTSELSSFDGDIVFSSDEENEKRMSFKAAESRLAELLSKKVVDLNDQNQDKSTGSEAASKLQDSSKECTSFPQFILTQPVHKPNSKYSEYEVTETSAKKTYMEKVMLPSCMNQPLISKRGRPKKILSFEEAPSMNEPSVSKRGRPKKILSFEEAPSKNEPQVSKRGRGRPRKVFSFEEAPSMNEASVSIGGKPKKVLSFEEAPSMNEPSVSKRGRPKKILSFEESPSKNEPQVSKRGRGRPRKVFSFEKDASLNESLVLKQGIPKEVLSFEEPSSINEPSTSKLEKPKKGLTFEEALSLSDSSIIPKRGRPRKVLPSAIISDNLSK